jgi:hypothetical protein
LAATYYRLGLSATDPGKAKEAYDECRKIRKELAAIDPQDTLAAVELALALARTGNLDEAERIVGRLLTQAGKDRQVLFQVACILSILSGVTADKETAGRYRDQAFQVLRDLVKAGWTDRGGLESDPDFDFIREDSRSARGSATSLAR